jgi:hypothetical protein
VKGSYAPLAVTRTKLESIIFHKAPHGICELMILLQHMAKLETLSKEAVPPGNAPTIKPLLVKLALLSATTRARKAAASN